jgi:hypothetical protein
MEEIFDASEQCDPDEDPDLVERFAAAWPRRARLKPDSTLATPLTCYDRFGSLDPGRLLHWHQEHATPAAPHAALETLPECGQRPLALVQHPALESLPECGLQAAPSAPGQGDDQVADKSGTSLPGTTENIAPAAPAPVTLVPSLKPSAPDDSDDTDPDDEEPDSLPGTISMVIFPGAWP